MDEDASFDVPAAWKGDYFMSFIPDGYTLEICEHPSSIGQEIIYVDSTGNRLRFSELSMDAEINMNTEGFQVSSVLIDGNAGLFAENTDESMLVWSTTDRYFVLNVNNTVEAAKKIAEKVVCIK